jgi:preprotein translocase subunit SecY
MNQEMTSIKRRLLVVLIGLVVFRLGSHVPVPGIDLAALTQLFNQHQTGLLGLFNVFSGGSLSRFSIFALGVMPYISASIIMQLGSSSFPMLIQLKKEGDRGQQVLNRYTRYLSLIIALVQGFGVCRWLKAQQVIAPEFGFLFLVVVVVTLATGTLFLIWLGEQLTDYGIGNGVSLIICSGIIVRLPEACHSLLDQFRQGQLQGVTLIIIALIIALVVYGIIYFEKGQRQIRINYARRQHGQKMSGGSSSHLPLKLNMSGVIPPIFASAIILLPATIANFYGVHDGWLGKVLLNVSRWLSPGHWSYSVLFAAAIFFFSYFYQSIVFNPQDTANQLKKSGALVPGVRPGSQTADYIKNTMDRLTIFGSIYLCLVCLVPQIMIDWFHVSFYFGGTSLLIVIVVVMDLMTQVQSQLMAMKYRSIMKQSSGNKGQFNLF